MGCLIETTFPSDYDTAGGWCCTIGKSEYESLAWWTTRYLQQHGDEWVPVFYESVERFAGQPLWMDDSWWVEQGIFFLPESWLEAMQVVRRPRQGPPHLRLYGGPWRGSEGVLGFEWPNGRRCAAAHEMSDAEVERRTAQIQGGG